MPASQSSAVTRNATVFLAVIAAGAALFWLRDILTPLALAMFLAVMIDGFARVLEHRLPSVSRRGATPLAILLSALIFGGSAFFITENAASFGSQLAAYTPRLDALLAKGSAMVGMDVAPTVQGLLHQLKLTSYLGQAARYVQDFASTAGFVLVYLGFILASRHGFERKFVGLFPQRDERQDAMAAFLRIRDGVEQYLWVQTVTGLMIAAVSWIAMVAVGLDNATFWTFVIFIASYIPVVGGIIGVAAPPVFALVQFPTLWQAIVLFAVLQTVTLFVGNVIYPRMQSRSVNLDPVVVLLALAFWSAIWGMAGAFLSTPLTVMMMVVLAQFPGTRWIAVILSADGDPQQLRNKKPDQAPDVAVSPRVAGRGTRKS
jgi:predicted PurR-regulated permease PerM